MDTKSTAAGPERHRRLRRLPTRETLPPRTAFGRWSAAGGRLDEGESIEQTHPWYAVMWLTGMDYFSSLAFQAGIALVAAGALAPVATFILVAVTVLGAVPVYAQVARRSYVGQGSIAILENLLSNWASKVFVLILLGFAATDFVITMTLCSADAAKHAIENPYVKQYLRGDQMTITVLLLALLAGVFLMGFKEAIWVSVGLGIPYLAASLIVFLDGVWAIMRHPALLSHWRLSLAAHGSPMAIFLAAAIVFPKLALGLSGFETGVSVMPLIDNDGETTGEEQGPPWGRIRDTWKLLLAAALIMGFFLMLSSIVTVVLIPKSAYMPGGPASGRAPAYLAHQLLGNVFGTVYDLLTIAILWFAGASAMAGLVSLIPRYLPRFGMSPRWVAYRRPTVIVLLFINLVVTWVFHASVEAQASAFATGVLALILSAAVAAAIVLWREFRASPRGELWALPLSAYFWGVTAVFAYMWVANIFERPDGVIISSIFILTILIVGATSRYQRARELRVSNVEFVDSDSEELWFKIAGKKVNLVPIHSSTPATRAKKATEMLQNHKIESPLAFLHVNLIDNRSEFMTSLRVRVLKEGENYLISVWGAVAVANTIAYLAELLDPKCIFLELTRGNLMSQSLNYLLWGEGETGLMVYTILVRYWEWVGEKVPHPKIVLTTA